MCICTQRDLRATLGAAVLLPRGDAMLRHDLPDLRGFVELEMANIFDKVWTYVGHESQVAKPGDYWTTIVGRQPMILVRHQDGSVRVLFNRCPHRGNMLIGNMHGNTGKVF